MSEDYFLFCRDCHRNCSIHLTSSKHAIGMFHPYCMFWRMSKEFLHPSLNFQAYHRTCCILLIYHGGVATRSFHLSCIWWSRNFSIHLTVSKYAMGHVHPSCMFWRLSQEWNLHNQKAHHRTCHIQLTYHGNCYYSCSILLLSHWCCINYKKNCSMLLPCSRDCHGNSSIHLNFFLICHRNIPYFLCAVENVTGLIPSFLHILEIVTCKQMDSFHPSKKGFLVPTIHIIVFLLTVLVL